MKDISGGPLSCRELIIPFFRYELGKLIRHELPLKKTRYVAISHVWGKATSRDIPGFEGKVEMSGAKAKFVIEQLSGWMSCA